MNTELITLTVTEEELNLLLRALHFTTAPVHAYTLEESALRSGLYDTLETTAISLGQARWAKANRCPSCGIYVDGGKFCLDCEGAFRKLGI